MREQSEVMKLGKVTKEARVAAKRKEQDAQLASLWKELQLHNKAVKKATELQVKAQLRWEKLNAKLNPTDVAAPV